MLHSLTGPQENVACTRRSLQTDAMQKMGCRMLLRQCVTGAASYLAGVVALVVQGTHQLHHVAHPVLWTRVKHVDLRMIKGVPGISHGIPSLPRAD